MEKTTAKERVAALARYKNMGWTKFQDWVGLTGGTIRHLKEHIPPLFLQQNHSPNAGGQPRWLLTGNGDMLITDQQIRERRQAERLAAAEQRLKEHATLIPELEK